MTDRGPTSANMADVMDFPNAIAREDFSFQLGRLFTKNIYLADEWHDSKFLGAPEPKAVPPTWRLKERMKTAGVALVVCLNLGTDPPDVVKPVPCARRECWIDPVGSKQKNLESIGHELQHQYEKWQGKAKYKQCLDPTSEDLRRVCINLRKTARNDRLLLHYNGHGVPLPTKNGELWVFGKHYTHYMPVAIFELRAWLGDPAIYVLDCSHAGTLLPHFVDSQQLSASMQFSNDLQKGNLNSASNSTFGSTYGSTDNGTGAMPAGSSHGNFKGGATNKTDAISEFYRNMEGPTIVLAACRANEILPLNPMYPADVFTSALTTPLTIALRWFILHNSFSVGEVNPDLSENIPGKDNDRKTPRGELNWIFTAITDTIAWTTLPSTIFQKIFRQDLLVASLFRNFLLAKRIMKSLNCSPQSWPPLPDSSSHPLWHAWDLATQSCISHVVYMQKGAMMVDPRNNMSLPKSDVGVGKLAQDTSPSVVSQSAFFTDNLTAFETWLDFGGGQLNKEIPLQLPILLQVLLSQTHRLHALLLLKRYLALGPEAVNLSLMVGIFPYILKLLQSPSAEVKQVLVCIWASVLGFDPSCRMELVRDKSQTYFIQYLGSKDHPASERCMAAFVISEVCSEYREGQQTCLQLGLHRTCATALTQPEVADHPLLKRWICLCLFKCCEDFGWSKHVCLSENTHLQLYALLEDPDPPVRAAAILALGEMFGASDPGLNADGIVPDASSEGIDNARSRKYKLRIAEQELAVQVLESCSDGSVIVRKEALVALSKFCSLPSHASVLGMVSREVNKHRMDPKNPWKLNPEQTHEVTEKMVEYMSSFKNAHLYTSPDAEGSSGDGTPVTANSRSLTEPSHVDEKPTKLDGTSASPAPADGNSDSLKEKADKEEATNTKEKTAKAVESFSHIPLMAAGYVGFLLTLYEIEGKDPHMEIRTTAMALLKWIQSIPQFDQRSFSDADMQPEHTHTEDSGTVPIPSLSNPPSTPFRQQSGSQPLPALSPLGIAGLTMSPSHRLAGGFGRSPGGSVRPFPFGPGPATGAHSGTGSDRSKSSDARLDESDQQIPISENASLVSHIYLSFRAMFLEPDEGYDSKEDPLSEMGCMELYRQDRLNEVIVAENILRNSLKDSFNTGKDGVSGFSPDNSLYDDAVIQFDDRSNSAKEDAVTKDIKFEQRVIINIDNADITSHVMFHAFLDILAISDGVNVGIWSLTNGSRIMQIQRPCDPTYEFNLANKNSKKIETKKRGGSFSVSSTGSGSAKKESASAKNGAVREISDVRITSMVWVNESYDALLALGADNGSVSIWRDTSNSDPNATSTPSRNSVRNGGFSADTTAVESCDKVASFFALPDVAETTRGSGLVMSWQQRSGTLVAGGNSSTIRLWDLKREQCVRVFSTGLDTCTTTLLSKTVAPLDRREGTETSDEDDQVLSWTFAGFADGSIGVFDERVQGTGRVAIAREHSAWIVSAHFRPDVPEVITGSVRGSVKFWDLRTMRSFKTLEVHKSPLTALTVHPCAPIMATGSHAQFIKILSLSGEQLGGILKYHDGFLGQRIGPVSCLAFHPTKVLLAAGATDSIVSIYGTRSFGT